MGSREYLDKTGVWAIELEGMAATFAPYEEDYDRFDRQDSPPDEFDINALFAEL
jgi:hypothetical protein